MPYFVYIKKYDVNQLMYFEEYEDVDVAIKREKRIKKYNRQWKINLIEKENPLWNDLYENLLK